MLEKSECKKCVNANEKKWAEVTWNKGVIFCPYGGALKHDKPEAKCIWPEKAKEATNNAQSQSV